MIADFISKRIVRGIGVGIGGLILMVMLAFLFGLFVMLLWNWLMPEIFGLTEISYWQGWGIALLAHLLFKSGGHNSRSHRGSKGKPDGEWKDRFRDKFSGDQSKSDSPEE